MTTRTARVTTHHSRGSEMPGHSTLLKAALLLAVHALAPAKAFAHGGGFDFHVFGLPTVPSNLVWLALFATICILLLFVLDRYAEERVRAEARAAKRRRPAAR